MSQFSTCSTQFSMPKTLIVDQDDELTGELEEVKWNLMEEYFSKFNGGYFPLTEYDGQCGQLKTVWLHIINYFNGTVKEQTKDLCDIVTKWNHGKMWLTSKYWLYSCTKVEIQVNIRALHIFKCSKHVDKFFSLRNFIFFTNLNNF